MIKLFISHSSADAQLAELVVHLFTTALGLRSHQIRCTSVDGYRLPGGADSDQQLREEVLSAECFIGILSPPSLSSAYVLFELGARWGARKHLIPIMAPGMKPQALRGPLAGLNALRCENMAELHQLIHEVGQALNLPTEPPATYQKRLEGIAYYANTNEPPMAPSAPSESPAPSPALKSPSAQNSLEDYREADAVIEKHCERNWPDDFSMRAFCISHQREAVARLRGGRPGDVPEAVFLQIRRKCALDWPDDYSMRQFAEEQQFTAFRKLHPGSRP